MPQRVCSGCEIEFESCLNAVFCLDCIRNGPPIPRERVCVRCSTRQRTYNNNQNFICRGCVSSGNPTNSFQSRYARNGGEKLEKNFRSKNFLISFLQRHFDRLTNEEKNSFWEMIDKYR